VQQREAVRGLTRRTPLPARGNDAPFILLLRPNPHERTSAVPYRATAARPSSASAVGRLPSGSRTSRTGATALKADVIILLNGVCDFAQEVHYLGCVVYQEIPSSIFLLLSYPPGKGSVSVRFSVEDCRDIPIQAA
jgi:hypothetical protein